MWLPRLDPDLFVPGTTPGRTIEPPDGPVMLVRIDSRSAGIEAGSRSATCAFAEVVVHVGAARGTASGRAYLGAGPFGPTWASDLQKPALSHVAESSCGKYTGRFNMFVTWCDELAEPRVSLPASDGTVTIYMQTAMNDAKKFAPVKAASATIAFCLKINLFDHEPT